MKEFLTFIYFITIPKYSFLKNSISLIIFIPFNATNLTFTFLSSLSLFNTIFFFILKAYYNKLLFIILLPYLCLLLINIFQNFFLNLMILNLFIQIRFDIYMIIFVLLLHFFFFLNYFHLNSLFNFRFF